MSSLYDRAGSVIRQIYDNRIDTPPVLDPIDYFPNAWKFTRAWEAIRDEALALVRELHAVPRFHEIMPEQVEISANDGRDWRMFILKAYGTDFPKNLARCPILASLLAEATDVLSASISFLAPGKHIPPHRGPFRGVLRYYLGLSMPRTEHGELAAVLKVADTEYRIRDGEAVLWDDTYRHEAWNNSDQVRIVLLLDVWRPWMPFDMRLLSKFLIGVVRVGIRLRGAN